MSARREGHQLQWFDIFPVNGRIAENPVKRAEDALVCDVGGGHGHELVKWQENFPDVPGRLVLGDLASTAEHLSLPLGVEKMAHDFLQLQPVNDARFSKSSTWTCAL